LQLCVPVARRCFIVALFRLRLFGGRGLSWVARRAYAGGPWGRGASAMSAAVWDRGELFFFGCRLSLPATTGVDHPGTSLCLYSSSRPGRKGPVLPSRPRSVASCAGVEWWAGVLQMLHGPAPCWKLAGGVSGYRLRAVRRLWATLVASSCRRMVAGRCPGCCSEVSRDRSPSGRRRFRTRSRPGGVSGRGAGRLGNIRICAVLLLWALRARIRVPIAFAASCGRLSCPLDLQLTG